MVKYQKKLKREDWKFIFHDAHPAYITWTEFLENRKRLSNNLYIPSKGAAGAPREGAALLQGRVFCGKCGRRMHPYYPNTSFPHYICMGERVSFGGNTCQSMAGDQVDYAVEQAFLAALKPAQLEMSLQALERSEQQSREIDRQWELRLQRAEKDVSEAEERVLATDHKYPRAYVLVQENLEKKQAELDALKREREDETKLSLKSLSSEERTAIHALAQDFPQVWNAGIMDMATKKNLLRCLIADVALTRDVHTARVDIRWKTRACQSLTVKLFNDFSNLRLPPRVLEFIKERVHDHTDRDIADALNKAGIPNGKGGLFTKKRVKRIRERYKLTKHPLDSSPDRRDDCRYRSVAVARMLGVPHGTVSRWCKEGRLDGSQNGTGGHWWVKTLPEELAEFEKTIRRRAMRLGSDNNVAQPDVSVLPRNQREEAPKGGAL